MTRKIGNPGSKLHAVKLTVLYVLYRAEREIDLQTVLERGWPETFPHRDPWGCLFSDVPDYEAKLAFRVEWMNLERDAGVALRDLRQRGLAKSRKHEGYSRNQWRITQEGRSWLEEDAEEFAASIACTLDQLPTVEEPSARAE